MSVFDVIIIGAGPCGLFTSYELLGKKKICIIDAGVDLAKKVCHIEHQEQRCKYCKPICNILGGFGGAQFFLGTKLSQFPAGSGLINFCTDLDELNNYYDQIEKTLNHFGKNQRIYPH